VVLSSRHLTLACVTACLQERGSLRYDSAWLRPPRFKATHHLEAVLIIFPLQEFKEVSKLSKDDTGIELRPNENNIYAWKGFLQVHNVFQVHLLLLWAMTMQ
jgi:hypothetical protein